MTTSKPAAALALALTLAALAGCGGHGGLWHDCTLAASPDRSALAYAGDGGVVLMREGKRFTVPFAKGGCLEHGDDIDLVEVMPDGWRVLVLGETTDASFMDPHPDFDTTVACIVDFRTRRAVPLAEVVPAELELTDEIRHRAVRIGGRTGRIYTWTGFGPPAIFDPATGKVAVLEGIHVPLSDGCDVAENERAAVMACTGYRERDAGGYDGFVEVIRMELGTWPLVPVVEEIAAPAPPDRVALSPDAARVAFWKNELDGGGYLRVAALAAPDGLVELPHGDGRIGAVAFVGDDIVVGSEITERSREKGLIRFFDGAGAERASLATDDGVAAIHASGGRLFVDDGCSARWIDRPR